MGEHDEHLMALVGIFCFQEGHELCVAVREHEIPQSIVPEISREPARKNALSIAQIPCILHAPK